MIYELSKFKSFLDDHTKLAYLNSDKSEIVINCPWCEPDSTKTHGHLYISTTSPVYNCFHCNKKGFIAQLVEKFDSEKDFNEFLLEEYAATISKYSYVSKINSECENVKYKHSIQENIIETHLNSSEELETCVQNKISYLEKRLGRFFDIKKLPRVIYDIKGFLEENHSLNFIKDYHKEKLDIYQEYFVGFLCTRGKRLVMRCILNNLDHIDKHDDLYKILNKRYITMNLTPQMGLFTDFYGIQTGYRNKSNTIVLCEGIFDVLMSVYHPVLKDVRKNSLYWASVNGKYYDKVVSSVIDYCKIPSTNLIILSDSEIEYKYYKRLKYLPFVDSLKIYWNKLGEDFGVPNIELKEKLM